MTARIYYLDHAAATPVDERVIQAMQPYLSELFYNPSSPYEPAVHVRRDFEAAKSRLAVTFGGRAEEIVMTAGATESVNLAFSVLSSDGHVVTSAIEHDAVLASAARHRSTIMAPSSKGIITADTVAAAIQADTELVSVQLANNEIGTIQPVREIASVVEAERRRRLDAGDHRAIWLHCDASQGFGQIDVHVARLGVDMLTLNAGKMYGPKQVGLLWAKPGVSLRPYIVGGGQERGLRSGTENVAGMIGFAMAAELASDKRKTEASRLMKLRDILQEKLTTNIDDLTVTGHERRRLPGSLHVSIPGIDGERLVFALELEGVLVATGSACAANKGTRSHVLDAIGLTEDQADGSLRMTLGHLNDESSVREAAEMIVRTIRREKERLGRA